MTLTAAVLVIISAIMHTGWNLFSKSQSPTIGFFLLATIGTIVWFSPICILSGGLIMDIPLSIWGILMAAGLFQAIYYAGLAGAYRHGALSIAYPLARSLPLLIVAALTFGVGRGSDLSAAAIIGCIAIVSGAFILPMNHFKDLSYSNYLNYSCIFALVAAIGTAGYSFLDDIGMNMLKVVPGDAAGWLRALLYLVLECVCTVFWLGIIMVGMKEASHQLHASWRKLITPALFTGLVIGATYGFVLLAMTHAKNVSYVVALRQLSIPLGTLLGVIIMKEPGSVPRFVGVAVLFAGLVLVSLG